MTMQHEPVTYAERQKIELWLLGKWGIRRMAMELGRDHSVVSREARRNRGGGRRYRADAAQKLAEARAGKRRKGRKLDRDAALADWVSDRLREGWSPEKIAGRLRWLAPPELAGRRVSHESVYRWLYDGDGRLGGLRDCLWTRRRRRWSRKGRKTRSPQIQGREPVSSRPEDGLPGHLESDSMVWRAAKGLLSVQVDRATLACRLAWCPDRTAEATLRALRRCAETLPHGFVRDVAFDNGTEGARHLALREEYGAMTYFCAPHAPWQKPQVENLNRTIRHRHPRKTKAQDLAALDWKTDEDWLNNLPRKSLNYLTPNEALNQYAVTGALET
jgi:transposase, IS30 family